MQSFYPDPGLFVKHIFLKPTTQNGYFALHAPMRSLILALTLAACTPAPTPDARYAGMATPTQPSDLCKPARAILRIRDGHAILIPDETTWSLSGTATPAGVLTAERDGIGPNRQPFPTRFTGTWSATEASGTYTTPRCTFAITLTRG